MEGTTLLPPVSPHPSGMKTLEELNAEIDKLKLEYPMAARDLEHIKTNMSFIVDLAGKGDVERMLAYLDPYFRNKTDACRFMPDYEFANRLGQDFFTLVAITIKRSLFEIRHPII